MPACLRASLLVVFCGALSAAPALAQGTAPGRLELGGQAALLRLGDPGSPSIGLGARATVNLSRWAALEGEVDFYRDDTLQVPSSSLTTDLRIEYSRRRTDAFFGAKAGLRRDRFGIFVKARPGLTHLSDRGVRCVGPDCALILTAVPEYRTEFAFDLGGVLELYPSRRAIVRLDVGDTVIRHRSTAPPCFSGPCARHYLASRVGVGLRF